MKKVSILTMIALMIFSGISLSAQISFELEKDIPVSPVKDQHKSGTCWSFATTSFLESELIRMGEKDPDISEMYFVRKAYELKAEKFVRMHGKTNFGNGGLAMDVMHILENYGMLNQEDYPGYTFGSGLPQHNEMDGQLRDYVDGIIKNRNGKLSPVWMDGFNGILDAYLGELPEEASYDSPIIPSDYIAIGSFTHQPYYRPFPLEIPDNWLWSTIYNLPLDEMMDVLEQALAAGYSVCWDGDVGEMGYSSVADIAILPDYDAGSLGKEKEEAWNKLDGRQKRRQFFDYFSPFDEKEVDAEQRQKGFDDYSTTDDHLEHICGLARDQEGRRFYRVKNSWGSDERIYDGFQYFSENYVRAKTIFIMLHKDALPGELAQKLNL